MSIEILTVVLFASLLLLLALGVPVAFALGGIAVIFTIILWGPVALFNLPLVVFKQVTPVILALPLFALMALGLQRSGTADLLYSSLYKILGSLKGGLAMGTILICVVFGAISGSSTPAVICMTFVALPSMLRRGYNKHLSVGCIASGGVLGIIIPPSLIMIIYASVTRESVGMLFFGGLIPGLIVAGLFITYIAIRCKLNPKLGPPIPLEERVNFKEKILALREMILPGLLILTVLGVIYTGIATPTEAAGIGAFGCFVIAAINRRLSRQMVIISIRRTLGLTCMVLWILGGAGAFNAFYVAMGARDLILELVTGLAVNRWFILIAMQLSIFFFGMLMDDYALVLLIAPIYVPIVAALGFSTMWFAILFILNMQMAYLTPPYGFVLFILRGIVPKGITMMDVYRAIVPFVALQGLGLVIAMLFPPVVTWLPSMMIKRAL